MTDDRLPSLVRASSAFGRKPGVFPADVVKEDDRTRGQNFADLIANLIRFIELERAP
jgi:hypothetical protein